MELRVLRYFLVVAREENITKAANLLHITQPTLSRQLMQLEEELGVKLFTRSRHSIILTEDGNLLRRRAQEIVDLAEKAERELMHEEEAVAGEIAIGCGETKNMAPLSRMIAAFQKLYPNVQFYIYTANADDVRERIENGILDFGLMLEPVDISKYNFITMPIRERWAVLMRNDSPLAAKEYIEPKDLVGVPLMTTKRKSAINEIENWFGDYYKDLWIVSTCNLSYNNRAIMVENNVGVGLVHEFDINNDSLCLRPLKPELVNGSVLVWEKDQAFSVAATKFIDFIKDGGKDKW